MEKKRKSNRTDPLPIEYQNNELGRIVAKRKWLHYVIINELYVFSDRIVLCDSSHRKRIHASRETTTSGTSSRTDQAQ